MGLGIDFFVSLQKKRGQNIPPKMGWKAGEIMFKHTFFGSIKMFPGGFFLYSTKLYGG